jgi:hypothetical protein
MSVENVSFELQNGTFPTPTTTGAAVALMKVQDSTYDKLALLAVCNQAVSLAGTGAGLYAPGCIGIDMTGASSANADAFLMFNAGTAASPSWEAVT